ncbi:MAG: hypothetical protein MJZ41_16455 [Bacteroidaceae bacterium]|nr:hypothetical protein [Bacteroidaceae bacterium]
MYKTARMMLLLAFLCVKLDIRAQEGDAETRKIEWGGELTTEMQFANSGKVNFANVLRLHTCIPINGDISLDISTLSTYMTSEESIGEDLQTFSNLDADNTLLTLSVCGIHWEIDQRNTLFLGVRNMNEDYFASDLTSLFTNSSCGIFPTLSANYPIANYPLASVGVHYRYEQPLSAGESCIIVQGSLYNGLGHNRFAGRENVFRFCPKNDGLFGLAQIEYQHKGSSYFLGACGRNGYGDEATGRQFGSALWTYAEQRLSDNLSLIADYSHAFGSSSFCTDFFGLGGRYSWKGCELGLFSDYARFADSDEFATELTMKIGISNHVHIQPAVHLISTDSHFHSAALLRLGVEF